MLKKIIFIKIPTTIFTIITVITMFIISYKIGFELKDKNLENIYLKDLTGITYSLMLSGIILSSIALALILISTFFSKWISFNETLWAIGLLFFFIGIILLVSGEGHIISKNEINETLSIEIIFLTLIPGLTALIIGATWFIKNKKNKNLKNELEIKQVNSKLRLFLFIIFNWYITVIPFILPICIISLISVVKNYSLIWVTLLLIFALLVPILFHRIFIMGIGIKYLQENWFHHYVKKNNDKLEKINNLEITDVTQLFNVIPFNNEVYKKNESFANRTKREFKKLSQIEVSANRLVVNGKINNLDFSWGIVTEMKKTNFKVFLLAILYFGPIVGIFLGLFPQMFVNAIYAQPKWVQYRIDYPRKLGGIDLFPYNVGRINSENYLIFAAKLQKRNDLITLIPNDNQYQWPKNLSETQKQELQDLIKEMEYLPSIYIYQDTISIMMKKYHYNEKDNNELQTWELLKQENSNNEIQFNYLNNAIKIYHIFNKSNSNNIEESLTLTNK
ncbi:hypothetical protein LT336_00659 [Spiroplasma sp. JKS002671]|uniref:hypothetical protein n=1 Tax=Spiroplasma attinicola TaxID=2904537 RepID=UPI0020229FAE|nr:hypothetical protein [Spiroplasma sp. JKS002671]MCL8210915.1 hypothetical protein [Spiroplasma sp. JKS002671]